MDEVTFTDIENELIEVLTREIKQERDTEVLYQIYKNIGWHEVVIPRWLDRDTASEVWCWCRDYLTGEYYVSGGGSGWLFQNESDAVFFALRWR